MNQHESIITEVNKDTFWALIAQAKAHRDGSSEWLMAQLVGMGPEQAKRFDNIASAYMALANQYGLWTAASVMFRYGCSDDSFIDFRAWLVAQGREVYMAALEDPDSLADAVDCFDWQFDDLPHMGDRAYDKLTGRNTYQDLNLTQYRALQTELKQDIVYGDGIGYPYDWSDIPAYLPRLCAKYLSADELEGRSKTQRSTWNLTNPDIQAARRTAPKSKKVQNRGNSR